MYIFRSQGILPNALAAVTDTVTLRVTPEMNANLLRPYMALEIKEALFQMHPSKASGPDGMSPLFYQKFWHMVGSDVLEVVRSFLSSDRLLREACFTHVLLIPKVKESQGMSQLRLISLCNVIYKIGAKVMANRVKGMLDSLISPHQSAFVLGDLISDNSLVAAEIGHFLHNKRSEREGFLFLKLDLSKAYDHVEWKFLEVTMKKLGFSDVWIKVIMMCVTSVSYSFLINAMPKGYVIQLGGFGKGTQFHHTCSFFVWRVYGPLLLK